MDSTMDLFNPPARSRQKRSTSSTRPFRSSSSKRSSSKPPGNPIYSDLIGMKTAHMPQLAQHDAPPLKFPSSVSVASKSSSSSTDTTASSSTKASSVAEITPLQKIPESNNKTSNVSEFDLFGTRIPPTEAELAPSMPDAVQLADGAYRVPGSMEKQFYRDLTFLEDEELITKYNLVKVEEKDRPRTAAAEGSSKKADRKTMLSPAECGTIDIVKFV